MFNLESTRCADLYQLQDQQDFFHLTTMHLGSILGSTNNRFFQDPGDISDAAFFGEWGGGCRASVLDYGYISPKNLGNLNMHAMEDAAKAGDYRLARQALFEYYKKVFRRYKNRTPCFFDAPTALYTPKLLWVMGQLTGSQSTAPELFTAVMKRMYMTNQALTKAPRLSSPSLHDLFRAQELLVGAAYFPQFNGASRWLHTAALILADGVEEGAMNSGIPKGEMHGDSVLLRLEIMAGALCRLPKGFDWKGLFPKETWGIFAKAAACILNMSSPTYGSWDISNMSSPVYGNWDISNMSSPAYGNWENGSRHNNFLKGSSFEILSHLCGEPLAKYFRWWRTGGRGGEIPPYTSCFGERQAVLRSHWAREHGAPTAKESALPKDIVAVSVSDSTALNLFGYGQHLLAAASGNSGGRFTPPLAGNVVVVNGQTAENTGKNSGNMHRALAQTNGLYDYLQVSTPNTPRMAKHCRDVLFIRPEYVIVTDFLQPEILPGADGFPFPFNSFSQTWHPMPHSKIHINPAGGATLITNPPYGGAGAAGLVIAQVNGKTPHIAAVCRCDGVYAAPPHAAVKNEFIQYNQTVKGAAVYHTVLFPFPGGKEADIQTKALAVAGVAPFAEGEASAFAMTICQNGRQRQAHFCSRHGESGNGVYGQVGFGDFVSNGRLAFVEYDVKKRVGKNACNMAVLQDGTLVRDAKQSRDLVWAALPFAHLGVRWQGHVLHVYGTHRGASEAGPGQLAPALTEADLATCKLRIFMDRTLRRAYLNGKKLVNVVQDGDYVYFGHTPTA